MPVTFNYIEDDPQSTERQRKESLSPTNYIRSLTEMFVSESELVNIWRIESFRPENENKDESGFVDENLFLRERDLQSWLCTTNSSRTIKNVVSSFVIHIRRYCGRNTNLR